MGGEPRVDAVLLLGPTASGKSAVSMALARRFPLEIVSVDSALVYRSMDIGTAKPDAAERAAVPHHLIDVVEPTDVYSAAAFVADARRLIGEIRARGRLPLLAGGTMLYAKALADGLDALPRADPATRAALDAQAAAIGWPAMHALLAQVDPVTAARLEPADAQRIQRALEIHALTGRPMSALLTGGARRAAGGEGVAGSAGSAGSGVSAGSAGLSDVEGRAGVARLPDAADAADAADPADAADLAGAAYTSDTGRGTAARPGGAPRPLRLATIALEPSDRAVLHARIGARFDAMLVAGFLDEVRALRARGDLHAGLPSMRCVGYRQAWRYLDALDAGTADAAARGRFVDEALASTRQLAKRQLTWLRSMPQRNVVDCLATDAADRVSAIIAAHGN
jgi:tRNA dimethylallyltransferase